MSMSSKWATEIFHKAFAKASEPGRIQSRYRHTRRPAQQVSLESLEPRQMLSVNPASGSVTTSSADDISSMAAFASQNTIGILSTVPSAPTAVVAVPGNAQLAVTWVAPASTGGSPITSYAVSYSSNGGTSWTLFQRTAPTVTSCTIMGLTNGTSYVVKVVAQNAVGESLPSANSAAVIPVTVPGRPGYVSAVRGDAQLTVAWPAPTSIGGTPITSYAVSYSSNGGTSWTLFERAASTALSCTVTGLTNGTPYVVKVVAQNAVGDGLPSANSMPITPVAVALTPTFGATTSTADGFTVQITNYNPRYAWAGTATAPGISISNSGLVTVTGVAAWTNPTATITTTRTGYVSGSATVTATSLAAATKPDPIMHIGVNQGGPDTVELSWFIPKTAGNAITSYQVQWSTDVESGIDGGSWAFCDFASGPEPINGGQLMGTVSLSPNTQYWFRVRAVNVIGFAEWCATAGVTLV